MIIHKWIACNVVVYMLLYMLLVFISVASSEDLTSGLPVATTSNRKRQSTQPTASSGWLTEITWNYNGIFQYFILFFFREMDNMMSLFGFDFAKTLQNKKKKLENFTNASLTSSDKKIKETSQIQQAERYYTCTNEHRTSMN